MSLIREEDKKELEKMFSTELKDPVEIIYFEGKGDRYAKEIDEILTDLSKLSDKIVYKKLDYEQNKEQAEKLGVLKTPCICIGADKGYKMKYYGIPSGYEFMSLVEDIKHVSKGENHLSDETRSRLKEIDKDMKILVFVTPTCPYCPRAVLMAHQFAMENKKIDAAMVEALEFNEWAEEHAVMAVPKIVINEKVEFEGAVPEEIFLNYVMEAAKK